MALQLLCAYLTLVVKAERVRITVDPARQVSGLLQGPARPRACYVMAHGAGAGMEHPFMAGVADELSARDIATLRYNFVYMEQGSKRPDNPKLAQLTVRAAVAQAAQLLPGVPLFAGGKSFGGRMTSQAQAESPLKGVRGLIFLAFPLHPSGQPSTERAKHLSNVQIPMLFLQGTRDALAELALLESVVGQLGPLARLKLLQDADHSFRRPARSGGNGQAVYSELDDSIADWISTALAQNRPITPVDSRPSAAVG